MTTIAEMVARWESADRPLFKGKLIDDDGCCCAQGDVLRVCGMSDEELRLIEQCEADRRVAKELGISVAQSVLLRQVNDREDGCPQDTLVHPERVLGDQAPKLLAFWRRLDAMTTMDWDAARAAAKDAAKADAGDAAWVAAWDAAEAARATAGDVARDVAEAARAAAWNAARDAARATAGDVARDVAEAARAEADAEDVAWAAAWNAAGNAAEATNEIQGAARLEKFFFLPMFGIADHDALEALK